MKSELAKHFHETYYPDMNLEDVERALDNENTFNTAIDHLHETHYPDIPKADFKKSVQDNTFVAPAVIPPSGLHLPTGIETQETVVSPKYISLKDERISDAASGAKLTDKNRLHSKADTSLIKEIVARAKKSGIDPYTALAMAQQETGLVEDWTENPFQIDFGQHKVGDEENVIDASLRILKDKLELGKKLGKKEEAELIQAWNGYGKVGKSTEGKQHAMYGIDVSKNSIDMNKNPVYGKRIIDIRENIIKKNPEIVDLVNSVK